MPRALNLTRQKELHYLRQVGVRLDFTPPTRAQLWFGDRPANFLRALEEAPLSGPNLKSAHHASVAHFLTPVQKWPAQMWVEPSYAEGFFWLVAKIQQEHTTRKQLHSDHVIYYPTVIAAADVAEVLKLWHVDKLKWKTLNAAPVWSPPWQIHAECIPSGNVTYFAVSDDHRYLTFGSAYAMPIGRKKAVHLEIPKPLQLGIERIGFCRLDLQKTVEGFRKHVGLVGVDSREAHMRNHNGGLFYLPTSNKEDRGSRKKILRRIAKLSANHHRRWILEGFKNESVGRNLLVAYVGDKDSKTKTCKLCGRDSLIAVEPGECATCGEVFK